MIDLTLKGLPNVVWINGSPFSIYTDYRLWMRFEIEVGKLKRGQVMDISYLFKNEMPERCNITDMLSFSRPHNPLPRSIGSGSDVIAMDYELDGDLIYSAFLGQYGIDLVEVEELHWHKFLALLNGLNEGTKLREVMGYRCYEKSTGKGKDIYEELRRAWEIEKITEENQEEIDKFNSYFE